MLHVTVDVFSGTANPSWIIPGSEAEDVLRNATGLAIVGQLAGRSARGASVLRRAWPPVRRSPDRRCVIDRHRPSMSCYGLALVDASVRSLPARSGVSGRSILAC